MDVDGVAGNDAGRGRIVLGLHGQNAVFSELSYRYPLKLLSPRVHEPSVAVAYILTYGGGLVSGDRVHLNVEVCRGAVLLLLTQGSTKVFKHRLDDLEKRPKSDSSSSPVYSTSSMQKLDVSVDQDALLLLLPDPVTCFSHAAYDQIQTFRLQPGASAVLLDWLTSGRMSRGEEWQFSRYYSVNEIWLAEKRIARDAVLLQDQSSNSNLLARRSLRDRMGAYSCYATLFLLGPKVQGVIASLAALYKTITIFQQSTPESLIWSLSEIEGGCIVRLAGKETELVKFWLQEHLRGVEELIGEDVYSNTFK